MLLKKIYLYLTKEDTYMLRNILMTRQFLYLNGLIVMNARVFMNCVLLLPVIQFGFCVFYSTSSSFKN